MIFSEIIKLLAEKYIVFYNIAQENVELSAVRLIDESIHIWDPYTLYFGYANQNISESVPNCIIATDHLNEFGWRSDTNNAFISTADFAGAFNYASSLLESRQKKDFYHLFSEMMEQVQDVGELIDDASLTFDASLVFIDTNYRVICSSKKVPVTDKLWTQNIRQGYCSYEFISEVKKLKPIRLRSGSYAPVEVSCYASPFRKLSIRVYSHGTMIGFLVLIESESSYVPDHPDKLKALAEVLGVSIIRYAPQLLYRTNDYHTFLYNLIIGASMETQMQSYSTLVFPDELCLLYVKSARPDFRFQNKSEITLKIEETYPSCHVIHHLEDILIIGGKNTLQNTEKLVLLFPANSSIRIGQSRTFSNIGKLKDAYLDAAAAYQAGLKLDPDRTLYPYNDYAVFLLLKSAAQQEDISHYLHSGIQYLLDNDQQNGQLLETLATYLRHNCSIKETAEALFMHRNSVIYRLQKIERLCQIDLNDVETQFQLRFSLKILSIL